MSGSNRKFGRNKNRPADKRYTGEKRWEKNKKLAIERHENRMAKKANKLAKEASRPRASYA